jgi:hypothetical protein
MRSENAREIDAEFKLLRSLNPNIKQPVFHASLSLPKHSDRAYAAEAGTAVKRRCTDDCKNTYTPVRF